MLQASRESSCITLQLKKVGIYSKRVSYYAFWKLNQSAIMWRKWRVRLAFPLQRRSMKAANCSNWIQDWPFLLLMLWRMQQYPLSLSCHLQTALSGAQGLKKALFGQPTFSFAICAHVPWPFCFLCNTFNNMNHAIDKQDEQSCHSPCQHVGDRMKKGGFGIQ